LSEITDEEKLERLRKDCPYLEEIVSIPVSYPRCRHPSNRFGACVSLEDCPRREEIRVEEKHDP